MNTSYKQAGVDIEAGYNAVELIKKHVMRTQIPGCIDGIGGFGGLFALPSGYHEPVLVSGADGVGTKLKIAVELDIHNTIGIDAVAMCVNDIICAGAKPLYFLDYIATGKVIPEKIEQIVSGIAEGCVQADCALIGGETAEHPGLMPENDYDIGAFATGIVEKAKILDKTQVTKGDIIIGLASSGVHSNGFSLIRKLFTDFTEYMPMFGTSIGEVLLTPTKIYVKPILSLLDAVPVKSISHITGGGFHENIPRSISNGHGARIDRSSFDVLPIFRLIQSKGNIPEEDMFHTFNMGIGMCVITAPQYAEKAVQLLNDSGASARIIGEVIPDFEGVTWV